MKTIEKTHPENTVFVPTTTRSCFDCQMCNILGASACRLAWFVRTGSSIRSLLNPGAPSASQGHKSQPNCLPTTDILGDVHLKIVTLWLGQLGACVGAEENERHGHSKPSVLSRLQGFVWGSAKGFEVLCSLRGHSTRMANKVVKATAPEDCRGTWKLFGFRDSCPDISPFYACLCSALLCNGNFEWVHPRSSGALLNLSQFMPHQATELLPTGPTVYADSPVHSRQQRSLTTAQVGGYPKQTTAQRGRWAENAFSPQMQRFKTKKTMKKRPGTNNKHNGTDFVESENARWARLETEKPA